MAEHRLDTTPPRGRRICLRCGWAEWDAPEPCRRPRVEPGMRFGKLTVVKQAGTEKWGRYKTGRQKGQAKLGSKIWLCRCDCKKVTEVPTHRLTTGTTRSCGCLRRELDKQSRGTQYERRQRKQLNRRRPS